MNKRLINGILSLLILTIISSMNSSMDSYAQEKDINTKIIVASNAIGEELTNLLADNIDGVKVKVLEQYDTGMFLVELNGKGNIDNILTEIENKPNVEFAQLDYKVSCEENLEKLEPKDSYYIYQWGLHNSGQIIGDYGVEGIDINVLPAWNITEGSKDVIVGVLDSGVDIDHEDLQGSIFVNPNEISNNGIDDDQNGYIDDVNGWNFINNDNVVFRSLQEDFHGTFIAGIIAANKNNIGICGVAPNVKIMPLKFISATSGNTSDAIKAIDYAIKMKVDIINCSWGGYDYNKALKKAMKRSKILYICSSGNEANSTDEKEVYPTCFNINNILTVGAIDNQGLMEKFSNYGNDVDVAAPGMNVVGTIPGNGYAFGGGTSFAAPYVTGIAALIKSVKPESTFKQLKKAIVKNVNFDNELQGKINTSGRVDAYKSVKYAIDNY
ncbi:S8 family peptidase [Lacrimispora sp.]|uniref:S8 family peptidase n=1 Tax=Lacrimispora sp. TaxID=2719234 RepID=UPI0028AF3F8E|nr:S8 family peptidase [Lacrimispora sp.]